MSVRTYQCPGDAHLISRSVHLARLAADYCQCRICPHRDDLGGIGLPPRPERIEVSLGPVVERERIFRSLRNPGAEREVLGYCEALAALLWQDTPWELPLNEWDAAETRIPSGPAVCVAWSDSETARSFASEVVRALSRNGCRVVSLGSQSRPALDFAVDHLDCVVGVWVEGGGSPAGVGFRVVGPGSTAWSAGGRLESLVQQKRAGAGRPSRSAGTVRTFDIVPSYREGLARHLAAAPAMDIAVSGFGDATARIWNGLEERVACQLRPVDQAWRCEAAPSAGQLRDLQESVIRQRLHGGMLLGADGRQIWFLDRREGLLTDRSLAERVAAALREEMAEREVRVVATEDLMWTGLNVPGARLLACGPSEEELVAAMHRHKAALGCDGSGRYWIARPTPRCDGLLTLAYLARALVGYEVRTAA